MKAFFTHIGIVVFALQSFQVNAQKTNTNKVLIPFREKKLYGLADTLGNIKVKPIYKEIRDFVIAYNTNFESRYVVKINKTYFVIDKNKKVLLPELNTYDSIHLNKYFPNHFWVYKKGKVGLFYKSKEIIPCLYNEISVTENESYEVKKGDLSGLINSLGKLIIPIEYVNIHPSWDDGDEKKPKFVWVAEGMLVEKKFYDTKIITRNDSDDIVGVKTLSSETILENYTSEKYNTIKKELEKKYDVVKIDKYNDIVFVEKNSKKGLVKIIDETTQNEIINPIYDTVEEYDWDKRSIVYKVSINGKYGLVKSGNILILDCEFDEITKDHILIKDNKKGMIVFNTIYPYIKPKYLSIKSIDGIQINNNWQFGLFEVTTEKGKGLVGENGVEFFKD